MSVSTGAQQQLHKGGILFVYGPFLKNGVETTQSNAQFNINLKEKNPEWGYRYGRALAICRVFI